MAVADLNDEAVNIDSGNDSIVIVKFLEGVLGGRTLNTTGFTEKVIRAVNIVNVETANGEYKPMPVSNGAYASLPSGHTVKGVLVKSVLTSKPFAPVMTRGTVNEVASPYPLTEDIKKALPLIMFNQD